MIARNANTAIIGLTCSGCNLQNTDRWGRIFTQVEVGACCTAVVICYCNEIGSRIEIDSTTAVAHIGLPCISIVGRASYNIKENATIIIATSRVIRIDNYQLWSGCGIDRKVINSTTIVSIGNSYLIIACGQVVGAIIIAHIGLPDVGDIIVGLYCKANTAIIIATSSSTCLYVCNIGAIGTKHSDG